MRIVIREVRTRAKLPQWSRIVEEVRDTANTTVKPRTIKWFNKVVENWRHKPEFDSRIVITKEFIALDVFPKGPNKKYWLWTSRGTKAHKITPKRPGGSLVFPMGFSPKTRPQGPTWGHPGGTSPPIIFAKAVDHPGTTPRKFEEAWAKDKDNLKEFKRDIENALRRGIRKYG